MCIISL